MEWKRLLSWHSWNKAFWTLFLVIGIILIIGAILGVISLVEILVAFIVIAIGAEKLGEEISDKKLQDEQGKINRDLLLISRWLGDNDTFTRQMKDRHEMRLLKLDKKRIEMERRQETSYRELARKVLEMENKLNETARALLQEMKARDGESRIEIRKLQEKLEELKSRVMRPARKRK